MECFNCGTFVDNENICPHCKANIKAYRMILKTANAFYNDGLQKAQVRDLSGAIYSLKECLKYNKYHIEARNLLGLVYFEVGEMVLALSEWVISKNFQPQDNPADAYLNELQNVPGALDKLNTTIKKYNQAILYCQQGNRDLARIQLRRVLGMNPHLVAGHQLLALLCIQDKEYEEAKRSLVAANKIDARNTTTLRYLLEVKERMKEQNANQKKRKRDTNVISFQDGNDTVVMPQRSVLGWIDDSKASIINILVGVVIGLLICFCLVVPTVRQNAKNDAANALVDANEEAASSSTSIAGLKNQVKTLQEQLEQYKGKGDVTESYEKLMEAKEAYDRRDIEAAASAIASVNADLLDEKGKAVYDTIMISVNDMMVKNSYNMGYTEYRNGNFDGAIRCFLITVGIDPTYMNGNALYYLADSYAQISDVDEAIKYYQQLLELLPDSRFSRQAKDFLSFAGVYNTDSDPVVTTPPQGEDGTQSFGDGDSVIDRYNTR